MKREDWRRAYEPLPDALERRVQHTLEHLETEKPARRLNLRTAAIVLAILLALGGVAYAIIGSRTADLFGWMYGRNWREDLLAGDIATPMATYRLGDVMYTLEEIVYKKDGELEGLYGVLRMSPAEGANVVLIPEDFSVDDPAGYLAHYGMDEQIPKDAPSYAELARERGAKLVLAKLSSDGLMIDGELQPCDFGISLLPQIDGSIVMTMEFVGEVMRSDSYELSLYPGNWEVTPEGEWLREEPNNTWLREQWLVRVTPTVQE